MAHDMKLDGGETKQLGSLSWNVGIDKRVGKTGKKKGELFLAHWDHDASVHQGRGATIDMGS